MLGGRGAGKTRTGAEWVRALAETGAACRIALVGETYSDVREVMIDGESGLIAIAPDKLRPGYEASRRRLVWPNGASAQCFSAEDPEGLRGYQFDAAWSDELCKWRYADTAWSNLQLGLRLGERPRQVVTTTPRPTALIKRLMAANGTHLTRTSTWANEANLAETFLSEITAVYRDTPLGRQELYGELVEDTAGALWRWSMIEACHVDLAPDMDRLVIAIDPPASAGAEADECGIVVAGRCGEIAYVLEDLSARGLSPLDWARRAVAAFHRHGADRIVAEVNQGGDMVEAILRQVDPAVPVRAVRASRAKRVRAEPVAALYERGMVRHVGALAKLEDQLVSWTGEGASPDRLDALVWALTDLMLGARAPDPTIRTV
ncbi:DNA-packaging protein [Aquisalinus flavus]|uniref:Large terminase n=1 Tax=Aquisalinus flavus TaxID=1526572 RepID=A0A8J2V2E8_9PROT|nr:terminase family protein [Aquisalinus flavus]GGD09201.1 large terminase [Aquisalinus flavus]